MPNVHTKKVTTIMINNRATERPIITYSELNVSLLRFWIAMEATTTTTPSKVRKDVHNDSI